MTATHAHTAFPDVQVTVIREFTHPIFKTEMVEYRTGSETGKMPAKAFNKLYKAI